MERHADRIVYDFVEIIEGCSQHQRVYQVPYKVDFQSMRRINMFKHPICRGQSWSKSTFSWHLHKYFHLQYLLQNKTLFQVEFQARLMIGCYPLFYRLIRTHSNYIQMENNRLLSRSIILDRVASRIQESRYKKHIASLDKIIRGHKNHNQLNANDEKERASYLKNSHTYVRALFNVKSVENQSLVKRMMEINRRKNKYRSQGKLFPALNRNQKWREMQVKKQNEILVQKIAQQRVPKTKQEILKEIKFKKDKRKDSWLETPNNEMIYVQL